MPKRPSRSGSSSRGKSRSTGSGKSASRARGESLAKDLKRLKNETRSIGKAARQAQAKGEALDAMADVLHTAADQTHRSAARTHKAARAARKKAAPDGHRPPLFVAGVGASAGGLEAFSQLLDELRPDLGMAFVFVQHLDPSHSSSLTSLLGAHTRMKVQDVQSGMRVEPNHVYVIPPNRRLRIVEGVLQLAPRQRGNGPNLPIDEFFRSLARDQGSRALGIVLSGNGHDGTAGLLEIKAEGGVTFAQDEKSAKFYGMPGSALHASSADFVLPPSGIAKELERISRLSPLKKISLPAPEPVLGSEMTQIFAMLRGVTGVDFTHYKQSTLKRRIARRMVLKRCENLKAYLKLLHETPAEVDGLFQDILINVTSFFRDPPAFQSLRKKIFPKILKQKPSGSPIRVWVPGCSTGEEVYSLAICLHEFLGRNVNGKSIQIFGTDVSEQVVSRARLGIFPPRIAADVSPARLRRYFQKTDGGYQICKFIRDFCVFARQNVAEDAPFSNMDLISCRNLLIYLGPELQQKVVPIFHYSLRRDGFLMLGTSESIGGFSNLFTQVDKKNKIYMKVEAVSRPDIEFPFPAMEVQEPKPVRVRPGSSTLDLQKIASDLLLSRYTPPGVIVNARFDVLHFRGKTGPYLEPASGSASLNLLKMVREELIVDVRTALTHAARSDSPVRKEGIRIPYNGHHRDVNIEVIPFRGPPSTESFFLVLFQDAGVVSTPARTAGRAASEPHEKTRREVTRLREELAQTKESLQSIIEEQEATNEELKSANEEIQSSNEELQSTNEELETAKEELQSTNEELTTLNEELQNRNLELSQANNDLNNLIGSFNMPLLMLDNDLAIRRFTPLAERLFNLIPSDIGRPISDINPNIELPRLDQTVAEVIESLNTREIEVQDRQGRWYSLRIRPYRTGENRIEGAVLVLVDIDDIRQGIAEMAELVTQPALILNSDLRINKGNQSFYKLFQIEPAEFEGRHFFEVQKAAWRIPALQRLVERMLSDQQNVERSWMEGDFPTVGRRRFLVSTRKLYRMTRNLFYIVLRFDEAEAETSAQRQHES